MILFKGLENIVSFLTESVCHFISTSLGACPRVTLSLRTLSLTATDGPCFVSVENDLCAVTSASSGSSALCTAEPSVRMMAMTAAALAFRKFVAAGRSDIDLFLNQLPGMLDVYANGMMAALITAETERHEQGKYSRIFYTAVLMFAFFQLWLLMKSQYAMSFPMEARKAGQLQHRFELSALGALILISGENSFLYIKRIFGNRVTRFLSDISFNTYIWHQVLAVKLKEWKIPNYISDTPQSAGEMPWQLHYTITCFFLAIILAILLTYLFDSPITKKLTKICIRRP